MQLERIGGTIRLLVSWQGEMPESGAGYEWLYIGKVKDFEVRGGDRVISFTELFVAVMTAPRWRIISWRRAKPLSFTMTAKMTEAGTLMGLTGDNRLVVIDETSLTGMGPPPILDDEPVTPIWAS